MKRILKKFLLGILAFIGALLGFLLAHNIFLSVKYKSPVNHSQLSRENVEEIQFISNLKEEHGEIIWPGFSATDIPVILFNEKYEFLVTESQPDSTWSLAKDQPFKERQLFIKDADNPQAFAVSTGSSYAGSLGFCEVMNRDMIFGIRSQTPPVLSHLIPFFLITLSPDMHISGLVHEMFHAFQATGNEHKFLSAENAHSTLQNYPYEDREFAAYWDKEGFYLEQALYTSDRDRFTSYVDSFLLVRSQRRHNANLDPGCIQAEKKLEWLEGMAKYVESRAYIIASSVDSDYRFKENNAYWELERKQRLAKLGTTGGDNRFYHSGAAQAFILDKLDPSWKDNILKDSVYMEDVIRRNLNRL